MLLPQSLIHSARRGGAATVAAAFAVDLAHLRTAHTDLPARSEAKLDLLAAGPPLRDHVCPRMTLTHHESLQNEYEAHDPAVSPARPHR